MRLALVSQLVEASEREQIEKWSSFCGCKVVFLWDFCLSLFAFLGGQKEILSPIYRFYDVVVCFFVCKNDVLQVL